MVQMVFKAGDFTGISSDYSQHRPDYCPSVLNALLNLLDKPIAVVEQRISGIGVIEATYLTRAWSARRKD